MQFHLYWVYIYLARVSWLEWEPRWQRRPPPSSDSVCGPSSSSTPRSVLDLRWKLMNVVYFLSPLSVAQAELQLRLALTTPRKAPLERRKGNTQFPPRIFYQSAGSDPVSQSICRFGSGPITLLLGIPIIWSLIYAFCYGTSIRW